MLVTAGTVLAGSAVGLLAFRGRLDKLALGFRPVLEAVLDVDNYLRQDPRGKNPRATIVTRYASLLRHICTWRGPGGRPFDALVIIAHSQGTAITADLLRFLADRRARATPPGTDPAEPELSRLGSDLPVYFFTMGCPLRQLYLLRFPHLYDWVGETTCDGPEIPADAKPAPEDLGLRCWVNAFRADDYVGRALWRSTTSAVEAAGPGECAWDAAKSRGEKCIGIGAHTHYWDRCGREVATCLDQLILRAAAPRPIVPAPGPPPADPDPAGNR